VFAAAAAVAGWGGAPGMAELLSSYAG